MHIYVRWANFTTKSRFRTSFFECALSVWDYSVQLYCNGYSFMQKLSNFLISKRGLMVKFARPDFNMQNGNSVGAGRCLWLAYFTYYHIVRLASFLRWFHLWRVDSPAFCLVQWHTDTQHRKDMLVLHKSVAAEKATYVKNYVKFINTRCSVSSQEQTLRRELRIRSASCSGVFLTNFEVIMRYCVDCF